ncbi:hypothetical protein FHS31_001974 [Sphingomonas vulcanisoli]|uniref:AsmA domain-containing protein n=1 Tax=Sphingomonas vulcanisoli TaxID=1658060 RepID=A0ABX0TS83_9SPHN|nr:AsmA family protein [Sphingomonas vulcanisoli]NIJ08357.1 hypothetical protein [Sphingomonas vulcanisoli]
MDMSVNPDPTVRSPAPRPLHTATATIVGILTTLLGLIFLAWLILFVTRGRFLKHTFERYASSYTQRDAKVAGDFNLYFDPIAIKFLAEGLTVSNPTWASKPNLFQSKLIDLRLETIPLIFGKKHVDWITLTDGAVDLEWDKKHKTNTWTFGEPDTKGAPFQMPLIERAAVSGTTLRYRDPQMFFSTDVSFATINAQDNRFANTITFTGDGTLRGRKLTFYGSQQSPNELAAGGVNKFEVHARAATDRLDAAGTLPGATIIEGADLQVAARGANLRNLFDLLGVVVPDTRAYHLRSHLTKVGNEWRFTKLSGGYGASDLAGTLTVRIPETPILEGGRIKLIADIASRYVDIVDIGPFIGYNPTALATKGATAAATTQHGKGDYPRILPDAPLRSDSIKTFDADVKYRVAEIKEPFVPVSNIVLGLTLDRSLLTLSPLNFDMAGGHVTSTISVNARVPAVITDYDIRMSPTPMGKLLARFGVADAGTTGTIKARIQMKGTGDSLRKSLATSNGRIAIILPQGTFWTKYTQLSEFDLGVFVQRMFQDKLKKPVQINCGLIGFTVRNGIAAADPVLIDTQANVMTMKGGFSFQDESLDFAFRADAKKFSLFSGQSPVGIKGHFAAPSIQIITPQLLARAGVGVGLGVLFPPAALIAFVDPGDAKAAACGPVLAGDTAAAQRTVKGKDRKDVGTKADNSAKAAGDDSKDGKKKKVLGIF